MLFVKLSHVIIYIYTAPQKYHFLIDSRLVIHPPIHIYKILLPFLSFLLFLTCIWPIWHTESFYLCDSNAQRNRYCVQWRLSRVSVCVCLSAQTLKNCLSEI